MSNRIKKSLLLAIAFIAFAVSANAQGIVDSTAKYPYYKDTFDIKMNASFEKVWNSTKELVGELGGQLAVQKSSQDEEGKYRGTIKSDNIIIADGVDSSIKVLQRYEYEMIYVPNGVWTIGRVNYRIVMNEIDADNTRIQLFIQLSGKENKITQIFHFFKSNGVLENEFLKKLYAKLGLTF